MKPMLLAVIVALTVFTWPACADIAPTTFTGGGVVTLENTEVRMERADVRIVWGTPCSLDADFVLYNKSVADVKLELGFPVGALRSGQTNYDLGENADEIRQRGLTRQEQVSNGEITISVNGDEEKVFYRYPGPKIRELREGQANWYFVNATLKPGANSVKIRTKLQASNVYGQAFRRRISYCIVTGGRWDGPIGYERVEIVFPNGMVEGLIQASKPDWVVVEGNSLVWEFRNLEPQDSYWDIELEIYLPAVMARLAEMKAAYEKTPASKAAALRYAAHLFVLGHAKGNAGFPPSRLNYEEFRAVRQRIAEPEEAATFERFYRARGDGKFAAVSDEWTEERTKILQILADAGFCDTYEGLDHVLRGRDVLEKFLAKNPGDADAWHLYLANFWRWSFAARGHWFGSSVASKPFAAAVKKALKHCAADDRIKAWGKSLGRKGEAPTVDHTMQRQALKVWTYEFDGGSDDGLKSK